METTGDCLPREFVSHKRHALTEREDEVRALVAARPDLTITALSRKLMVLDIKVGGPWSSFLLDLSAFGHWKTTTFVAALRHDRITAPCVFDGPINGETFLAYVEQALAPTFRATLSSWIISVPIKAPAFVKPSKPPGQRSAFCLPAALRSNSRKSAKVSSEAGALTPCKLFDGVTN